jgi:hypothetical protein
VSKPVHLVHADEYKNWIFDATHPTQGRRFNNARDLFISLANKAGIKVNECAPRPATRTPEIWSEVALRLVGSI